jgi:hypothetical protein
MSGDLKLSPFALTFRNLIIDIPGPLPTFPIRSSIFIDFTPYSFYFLGLSIRQISPIHFSTMV